MIIKAETAVQAISRQEATVTGWMRDDDGTRYAIISNHKLSRTDHVECGNRYQQTVAKDTIESFANACYKL